MKKILFAVLCAATTSVGLAEEMKKRDALDIRPEGAATAALTGVEWENTNDTKLVLMTKPERLAAFVANERTAKALLAQVEGAYRTDSLSARQIAAVSQWVMLPDPWYCLWWDGDHAAGRKVWIGALLARAETATDDYIREFCLDQLRWCGSDCPDVLARIRAIGMTSDSRAVSEMAELVIRELEKKTVGPAPASDGTAEE